MSRDERLDQSEPDNDDQEWQQLRARIDDNLAKMMDGLIPDRARQQDLWRARAELLTHMPAPASSMAALELLEFVIADEHYAIELNYVREIQQLKALTVIPCVPEFVLGVINLRGQIISAIDIRKLLSLPARLLTNLNKLIVVRNGEMELGLVADSIVRQLGISADDLQRPTTNQQIPAEFLKGMTATGLVVLNIDRILSSPAIIVREEVEDKKW